MSTRYPDNPELAAAMRDLEAHGHIECFTGPHGEARWRLTDQQSVRMKEANNPLASCPELPTAARDSGELSISPSTVFDVDVPFGEIDLDYSVSDVLEDFLIEVADLDDLQFRFWCAMIMVTNLSTIAPCDEAEDVVVHVISEAFADDCPIDQNYRPILSPLGEMTGVMNDEGDLHQADSWEALCFAIVSLTDVAVRASALIELAEICALTEANEVKSDPIAHHSLWRAEMMRQAVN